MFGNKKEKQDYTEGAPRLSSRNIIDKTTKIVGDIFSDGDFRIDGTLEGTLKTKGKIIIGQSGSIEGKIECENADVEGHFSGNLVVQNTLTAKSTAKIEGDVTVGQISTEPGARFNANCTMKGASKNVAVKNSKEKVKQ